MFGQRVLVAEDNPQMLELIVHALARDGHQVIAVTNGLELLDVLRNEEVDLVVSDLRMPEMTALDVLAASYGRKLPPFLILTAFPDDAALDAAARLGALGVLAKPIELDDLRLAA